MIIYKVTNKENGKVYIGKTVKSLAQRRSNHYYAANKGSETNFNRALRKYERSSFTWEVIKECSSDDELNSCEIDAIKEHDSFKTGYNMTLGGTGGATFRKGDELYERIKHKFSNWKNGNPGATPEAIKKRIETFKTVDWAKGENHGNYGHSHNIGILAGSKNPMFGKTPTNARPVEVDGVRYNSVAAAVRKLNISDHHFRKKCLDKNITEYKYLD